MLDSAPSIIPDKSSSNVLDMTTIKERIAIARKRLGIGQRELDRRMGLTGGTTWSWEQGKSKGPSRRNLLVAARTLGVEPLWLEFGEGPMLTESAMSTESRELAEFIESLPPRQRQAAKETLGLLGERRDDDPADKTS